MEIVVFENYGIEIIKKEGSLYVRYDAGEIVVEMVEVEIAEVEAAQAQLSENDAYEVILATQRRTQISLEKSESVKIPMRCKPC